MFSRKVQLFVVSGDEKLAHQVTAVTAGGFSTFDVRSAAGFSVRDVLERAPAPELILVDFRTRPGSALQFVRRLRHADKSRVWPVVFLANEINQPLMEALQLEQTDFALLPLEVSEFSARMHVILQHRDLFLRLNQQNHVLSHLAAFDDLTGLYNRRFILNSLGPDVLTGGPQGGGVGMFLIDLDNFKTVNDTCGHLAGDRVLVDFARLLSSCLRTVDIVGRYGGDEFCIVKPDATPELCVAMARRVLECLSERPFGPADDCDVEVTASIGVAYAAAGAAKSAQALIAVADKALYQAKQDGGQRFILHHLEPALAG